MPICNTCSTPNLEHRCSKVSTRWPDPKRHECHDICQHCDPEFHQDRVRVPVDQRLWLMADVVPEEYEYRDGVKVMKDWADAEHTARIAAPDQDEERAVREAKEKKRAQARQGRKTPLTPDEITRADNLFRTRLAVHPEAGVYER